MQKQLMKRLDELRSEFKLGQSRLQDLEGKVLTLRNNLLRISGAIQVLEEEIEKQKKNPSPAPEHQIHPGSDSFDAPLEGKNDDQRTG
jgi:predicted  nucleic acid-binding Zn-ribbon protein